MGELLGGTTFHVSSSSEAGGETNVSTLDQAGVISRLIKFKYPMMEAGLPEELVVTSEQRAKLPISRRRLSWARWCRGCC